MTGNVKQVPDLNGRLIFGDRFRRWGQRQVQLLNPGFRLGGHQFVSLFLVDSQHRLRL